MQVLRRHLIHIFEYDFPEHYGEVLQLILVSCSEQKILPSVLNELINSIYKLADCNGIEIATTNISATKMKESLVNFATAQNIFSFKVLQDTMALLARHFINDRLQYGLHGLYPKHKDYCEILAILFKSMGFAAIVSAVQTYPGVLAEKCKCPYNDKLLFLYFN